MGFFSLQTAHMEPMGLSAAKPATAKVASVTGRRELVSNSLPKSQASLRLSLKQVNDCFFIVLSKNQLELFMNSHEVTAKVICKIAHFHDCFFSKLRNY